MTDLFWQTASRLRNSRKALGQDGVILASLIVLMVVFMLIGSALASYAVSHHNLTSRKVFDANATLVAEAGIEETLLQLNLDNAFAGHVTDRVFFDNETQGRGVYQTTITDGSTEGSKIITAVARVYRHNQTDTPISVKGVKVTVVGTTSEGNSVHTGPGGLILSGSANITNSDVFVNGTIQLSGAAKIGTHANPVNVQVAHQACPSGNNPGPTFPQPCTTGQPITMAYSTNIYGTVCATNQTSKGPNNNIQPGNGGEGLQIGCVAPPVSPPTYDRAAHIAGMTTTASGSSNTYVCNNWPFDRTWPANLRLTGNVTIGGSCKVKISGNVYITGSLTINGAARVTVDESAGGARPVIIADGKITLGGSAQVIANSEGTGMHFISFQSSAACNPNCLTVTGTELKNSQNLLTVDVGGAVNLPGMIFQAYWGKVRIAGSGNIGAAVGQTVDLSGAGTVTFGTSLSSGVSTWTVTSYQQFFPD